ncbi:O-antigen/teichoic acid export membrane protein [Sulfuritortus calidifontis]|uniref:O-antigen/teichoic acid export membrane protein n=1 Tax=Sulfuritortus calidifontis TaxID=1914471 RepID=A0A4V2UQP5_9PROT|nr:flippase [Sulfuritortus calidifontis]TCS71942.1 O-antigen/teichoic acid export membrane protein [Sulfuritortus calidifontis]
MSIRRNTFYNLTGNLLPLGISLITVPIYLQLLGVERYGVLAIAWILLGYFSLFDLGLSRATANQIAKMRNATPAERQAVVWTALALNAVFGLIGSVALYIAAPPLLENVFKMAAPLRAEILAALPWMAAAIPLATLRGVLVGAMDGRERFLAVNIIHVLSTALIQIIPLMVAIAYGPQLEGIIAAAIGVRVLTLAILYLAQRKELPIQTAQWHPQWAKPLLVYGGWVSVTNSIIPILETLDRFIIGAMLGARAVAIYTVPFNLVNPLRILPGSLSRTLFPRLSAQAPEEANELAHSAMLTLAALLTPLTVAGMFIAGPFLELWVGPEIAKDATPLTATFLVGIWINSIAHIPFSLLEARGRPDLLTKLHLFTLPVFLGMLWLGAHLGGLPGVAMAWTARVWLDSNILFWLAGVAKSSWYYIWPGAVLIFMAWLAVTWQADAYILGMALTLLAMAWAFLKSPILRQMAVAAHARTRRYFHDLLNKQA